MTEPADPLVRLAELLDQQNETYERIIHASRAQERILAIAPLLVAVIETVESIVELDPELAPEITAATEQIGELAATFDRMQTFVGTRLSVEIERAKDALG